MMLFDDAQKPLTPDEVYDGGYWRQCATRSRDEALAAKDAAQQARLLRIANQYERLAGYADAIARAEGES